MIKIRMDSQQFRKEMDNIMEYSLGFVDGVQVGKHAFFRNLGPLVEEEASQFIDANARVSYQTLHHVYEWGQSGSSSARLFDIKFAVSNLGLSFISEFKQSKTIQNGSKVPFENKAKIMELGQPVIIQPVHGETLRFEVGGQVVYTKKPVLVENPGGNTKGQFENVWDMFFSKYFTQAFLRSSGISEHFSNPTVYKRNLAAGKRGGRSTGMSVGSRWVANGGTA